MATEMEVGWHYRGANVSLPLVPTFKSGVHVPPLCTGDRHRYILQFPTLCSFLLSVGEKTRFLFSKLPFQLKYGHIFPGDSEKNCLS